MAAAARCGSVRHLRVAGARARFDRDGSLWVEEVGSTNGTIVNGKRSSSDEAADGDRVQLGETVLEADRDG